MPYPTAAAAPARGDLMIAWVAVSVATIPAAWSGWTDTGIALSGISSQSPAIRVMYKWADGTESGNLTVTIASATAHGAISTYNGIDPIALDVAATTVNPASATTLNVPSLTTTRPNTTLVLGATSFGPAGTWSAATVPATFTEVIDTVDGVTPQSSQQILEWTGVGATGTVVMTRSSNLRSIGWLIALRPFGAPIIVQPPRRP